MPDKCCVPGCRSNYDGEYVSVFKFPSVKRDELRNKWIRCIPRQNWQPSARSVVCEKHFTGEEIIRFDKFTDSAGVEQVVNRRFPALKKDAFPTIFPNLPAYLTTVLPAARKDPSKRAEEIQQRHEKKVTDWLASDTIGNFQDLIGNYTVKLENSVKKQWQWEYVDNQYLLFYLLKIVPKQAPAIQVSITVVPDMTFSVYVKSNLVGTNELSWISEKGRIELWSQVENLLLHYQNQSASDEEDTCSVEKSIANAHGHLINAITVLSSSLDNTSSYKAIKFLDEQIQLNQTPDNRKRYSSHTLCFAFMAYIKSPSCYRFLRKSKLLSLPHPSTLKNLSSVSADSDIIKYLKLKCDNMPTKDKIVAVQMDEIHVKAALNYSGGKLIGNASNASENATTVQAFLISSVFGSYTDVVSLTPMHKMSSTDLKANLLQTIQNVQSSGLTVLTVIADNNSVNRKVYKDLSSSSHSTSSFDNPQKPGTPIFLLHDSVHLLKCIWHNWLNQKDCNQTFVCPPIPSSCEPVKASFSSVKSLYRKECNNIAKLAPTLSHKALFPSSLERQKVSLALAVFSHYNVAALKCSADEQCISTAAFINFILQWWHIVNVKSKFDAVRTCNPFAKCITATDRSSLVHLEGFARWLELWQQSTGKEGKLTSETFYALLHTVRAIINMSNYVFSNMNVDYILLGKFQTDNLEAQFGEYRQMSGANYLVSVQEILEAERKLKVYSVLSLMSSTCGSINILNLSETFSNMDTPEKSSTLHAVDTFQELLIIDPLDSDSVVPDGTGEALVYISGYVAFKLSKKLTCTSCIKFLQQEKALSVDIEPDNTLLDYTRLLDRGKLKYPSQNITDLTTIAYLVVQKLISSEYEDTFLACTNHRETVSQMITASYLRHVVNCSVSCTCGESKKNVVLMGVPTLANVFLNNYRKVVNDTSKAKQQSKSVKRQKVEKFFH